MNSFRQSDQWSSEVVDEQDLLVPVSLIFLAFLPVTWFLSNFDIVKSIDFLLVFGGMMLLSVAVKSAAELRYIYEKFPRSSDNCLQPVTHRHFMYAMHVFFAATFMVLARFDWQYGSKFLSIGLLILAMAAVLLGLSAMFSNRDPSRGRYYRRFDFGWILAWPLVLVLHIVSHLNLRAAGQMLSQLGI